MADEVIARSAERGAIAAFLAAVPSGEQAMLLAGEAGIGKTSLWRAGLRMAEERGFRSLSSRSSPSETQLAFCDHRRPVRAGGRRDDAHASSGAASVC